MESITKYRQSPETLRRMLASAYGADLVPADDDAHELGHGWFNVAYVARLVDGRRVVLKIAPHPEVEVMTYERDMLAGEVAAIRLIEQRTRVPVAHVDHYDASRALIDAEWFAMSFVSGENLGEDGGDWSADRRHDLWRQIGALNAELNGIVGEGFGRFGTPLVASWREAFTGIMRDVLDDGERRGVDLGWSYELVRRVVADNAGCLDAVTEPRFCEWDLWAGNVLVVGDTVSGIIDHERAFWGDPVMEAGCLLASRRDFGDWDGFSAGYGRGDLTPEEAARRRLYDLHLFTIMVVETAYRGHTTTDMYDMARGLLDETMAEFGFER